MSLKDNIQISLFYHIGITNDSGNFYNASPFQKLFKSHQTIQIPGKRTVRINN